MQSPSKFHASAFFTALMFGFMYLPIAVLTFYSFNEAPNSAQWKGFTFSWYIKFFQDGRILSALWDSVLVASLATGIAAIIGTLMAIGLARYQFFGKKLFQGAAYLPLIIPDIAIAVATLVFLAVIAVPLSLGTIVAAHVVFCLAYVALVVSTRLANLDPHLEEAALDLGATPFQSLLFVLLPQLTPAIVSGCLLAFVLSMDDFLISSFTAGGGVTTLPMEIFSRIRTSVRPDMNALSVVLMIASAGFALIAEVICYRSEKKRFQ
ncbi:ABC transporter permease [Leptolyngbya sp. NIES-2104]|uniref:ABC transporter permease n=1 Tax=Leptolyngbya sp. NIES-2104 TaxID=1552121 RepID=UPI0006EC95FB|nr:ABC transporter permease [Leptolyngbya sp. NIES-2104]GAP95889.1 spermidine putrescine ABC transporter permease component potC [Leptolyngbya sp. NIES-2104]